MTLALFEVSIQIRIPHANDNTKIKTTRHDQATDKAGVPIGGVPSRNEIMVTDRDRP